VAALDKASNAINEMTKVNLGETLMSSGKFSALSKNKEQGETGAEESDDDFGDYEKHVEGALSNLKSAKLYTSKKTVGVFNKEVESYKKNQKDNDSISKIVAFAADNDEKGAKMIYELFGGYDKGMDFINSHFMEEQRPDLLNKLYQAFLNDPKQNK